MPVHCVHRFMVRINPLECISITRSAIVINADPVGPILHAQVGNVCRASYDNRIGRSPTRCTSLHDNAPRDVHCETHRDSAECRAAASTTSGQRARQIRCSPLPVAAGIPVRVPTRREEREANRALCHLDLPSAREHGLQGTPVAGTSPDL
jgi:hypothetical protein